LNRGCEGSSPKPKVGLPLAWIALPFRSISFVFVVSLFRSMIAPAAAEAAVRVVDELAAAHDRVGVLVRTGEDRVEGLRDRVGDDEAPGHHRDPENDREARQDRANRAGGEALERDADHRQLTSCIAASTSTAVEP
jgi:hypothetical protein